MTEAKYDAIADWYNQTVKTPSLIDGLLLQPVLNLAGDLKGQTICDLACGQGRISQQLALGGAYVVGIDISAALIKIARQAEAVNHLGISYQVDNAETLISLSDETFDGVICHLALMDIATLSATFQSVWRILKTNGWFVFSTTHPCFQAPHARWETQAHSHVVRQIPAYFNEGLWYSTNLDGIRGKVGAYHRTLATYLNTLVETGFQLNKIIEPQASSPIADVRLDAAVLPSFMVIRVQKCQH